MSRDTDREGGPGARACGGIDTAVVILNKDNAEGLRKTLESLTRQTDPICSCFDVYVVDGGSRDHSREVVESFAARHRCIYFIEQRVKGGTGPARIEVIEILRNRGYRLVVWGDSENIYHEDYVRYMRERFFSEKSLTEGRESVVVSGRSLVKINSVWSRMFFWYHIYHQIFPVGVGDRHAPGNNRADDIDLYGIYVYPPCSRSEDFILSYYIYKHYRDAVRYVHEKRSVVEVSLPDSLEGVLRWQRARVRGLVECSRIIGRRLPPDLVYWLGFLLYNLVVPVVSIAIQSTAVALFYLVTVLVAWVFLYLRSRDGVDKRDLSLGLLGYIGMILHAFFTVYYTLKFLRRGSKRDHMLI